MAILLGILVGLVTAGLVISLASECALWSVYGWYVKEEDLDKYFEKNLDRYHPVYMKSSDKILFSSEDLKLPYIGSSRGIFSKWVFGDNYGVIHRSSKWHKTLNDMEKKVREANPQVTLRDLA